MSAGWIVMPIATAILSPLLAVAPAAEECFDLAKAEPHELKGTLVRGMAPGPPGFKDVRHGMLSEAFLSGISG